MCIIFERLEMFEKLWNAFLGLADVQASYIERLEKIRKALPVLVDKATPGLGRQSDEYF